MPVTTAATAIDDRAAELLRELAGPGAPFREHQLEAVRDLVADRARVLCVQRTGWGKSAVYFLATALGREAGAGPTLIVSPLLALMRNQIAAAERIGIRAHTINSTNRDAWAEVRDLLAADAVDVLLISPERLNNPQFRAEMLPLFAERVGLLVIDEAHCISDWGHDFRPDYRRIADMLERLPEGVPVLCTTATANDRVVADVEEQLSIGRAASLRTYRGPLGRTSLRFEVVDLPGQADRLAWLAQHLPDLPGSGIVYTLTKRDADLVAEWLSGHGVAAEAYSGDSATEDRVAVEERLLRNDLKAVVATSALGMGYDKPDLGFVVHYQAPGSRDRLLPAGRPCRARDRARRGRAAARPRGPPDPGLLHRAGVPAPRARRPRARAARRRRRRDDPGADGRGQPRQGPRRGDAQGARRRGRGRARRLALARAARQRLALRRRALRAHHRAAPPRAGGDGPARRRRALPDARAAGGARRPRAARTAGAARCAPARATTGRSTRSWCARRRCTCARARSCSRSRRWRPTPRARCARSPRPCAPRRAARWRGSATAAGTRSCRRAATAGRFDDELVAAAAEVVQGWGVGPQWVAAIPSLRTGELVPGFARALAERLGIAFAPGARARRRRPAAARDGQLPPAGRQRARALRGHRRAARRAPGLLVDDIRFSGWTLAMVAGQLRGKGAEAVYPLALSTAF